MLTYGWCCRVGIYVGSAGFAGLGLLLCILWGAGGLRGCVLVGRGVVVLVACGMRSTPLVTGG